MPKITQSLVIEKPQSSNVPKTMKTFRKYSRISTLSYFLTYSIFLIVPEENALIYVQSLKYDELSAEDYKSSWAACVNFRINQFPLVSIFFIYFTYF